MCNTLYRYAFDAETEQLVLQWSAKVMKIYKVLANRSFKCSACMESCQEVFPKNNWQET